MEKAPYNHSTGRLRSAANGRGHRSFLIVEGLLGLHTPSLRERYDVSVYLDTPEPLRHRWKVARDTAKRGYSATQVHELLERRESVSEKYIRPQREHADMVVRFHPDSDHTDYEHLHATVTMRPTLDQPDLRAVIDSCPRAASALRLTRNGDGEELEIDGAISAEQAAEVERELWSRRPELERLLMAPHGKLHGERHARDTVMRSRSRSCCSPIRYFAPSSRRSVPGDDLSRAVDRDSSCARSRQHFRRSGPPAFSIAR